LLLLLLPCLLLLMLLLLLLLLLVCAKVRYFCHPYFSFSTTTKIFCFSFAPATVARLRPNPRARLFSRL
jgi:hypothetical protein